MEALPAHLAAMREDERLEHERSVLQAYVADVFAILMEDLGVSRQELARRLGTSAANVSKLLSGSQNLKLSTVAALGHALGVRVRPRFEPAPRAGTPAEADGPLPAWVNPEAEPDVYPLRHGSEQGGPRTTGAVRFVVQRSEQHDG